ncbi:MAG TPA: hypothetical protein VFZ66_01415 [Herpetosiphonaceae bacterium]
MTTQPDPITGLRWIRPIKANGPVTVDDVRYEDGTLIRLGDVVQLEVLQPQPEPPFVENMIVDWNQGPPAFIRELTDARRQAFFPKHIDPAPIEVLGRQPQRSVCLVRPDTVEALFSYDEEAQRFEARLMPRIGRLYSEEGVPVFDPYWRKWGQQQLSEEEYREIDHDTLHGIVGEIYLVLGLGARGRPQVIGVHTIPAYQLDPDEAVL